MRDGDKMTEVLEKIKIAQLLQNWGTWRDSNEFEKLATCYTDDATMVTSWYDGSAKGFIDNSSQMRGKQPKETGAIHLIGGTTVDICADRAFAQTRITLLMRGTVHAKLVDVTVYGRFFDTLLQRDGDWFIHRREPIYDKDTLQTVAPGDSVTLDPDGLARQPRGFRHLAYVQTALGLQINTQIPDPDSDAEQALHARGRDWLQGQAK